MWMKDGGIPSNLWRDLPVVNIKTNTYEFSLLQHTFYEKILILMDFILPPKHSERRNSLILVKEEFLCFSGVTDLFLLGTLNYVTKHVFLFVMAAKTFRET